MIYILSALFLFFISLLYYFNSGRLPKLKDENNTIINNSIVEKVFLESNGCKLGMFIVGENINNPVLLFLHGGPGSSEIVFMDYTNPKYRLEKLFTVVYLDQRGAGLSNHKSLLASDITIEKMIKDNITVTKYLKERFNKKKIYLMSHSWGTYLAIKTIKQAPKLYYASINSSQLVNNKKNEVMAYHKILEHAISINDFKAIRLLKQFDILDDDFPNTEYLKNVRSKYLDKYGYGLTHKKTSILNLIAKFIFFKGYTLKEQKQLISGLGKSQEALLNQVLNIDITKITEFKTRIYIMQGEFDYQTNTSIATKYFNSINAIKKELFIFDDCAHSPFLENKKLAFKYLEDIINNII